MVGNVLTSLESSKVSGPNCIRVVVIKNCESELFYLLAELFNRCLKESCFPNCWKVLLVVPVCKNYCRVSLLSVVSKVLEKLVDNIIVDHVEKCFFSDFQYGLGLFDQQADLLTVVSNRIAGAFNRAT